MDKAIWIGSESARRAAMQNFIELKQDTEFWFAFIVFSAIAMYAGYWIGENEKKRN